MAWHRIPVTISLGVAAVPECVANARDVLGAADQALYASKEAAGTASELCHTALTQA